LPETLEQRLTAHLSNTRFEDLPPEAVDAGKKCILDMLGVVCAGSGADGIATLMQMLQAYDARPEATVLVHGTRLSAPHATWVNGAMARAREIDDSHDPTGDHIGVPIIAASLGAMELAGHTSGRDLIAAYVLGADLNARLRLATTRLSGETGFAANTFAPFSAATVSARLLGLTGQAMYDALAWAYAQAAGALQLQQSGSSALHIHHGLAASTGLQAALLAQQGLPGPDDYLTGKFGFYGAYNGGQYDESKLTDGLGRRFEITQMSVKLHPGGRVTHPQVEAALVLQAEESFRAEDVEEVVVVYGPRGFKMTCQPEAERRLPDSPQHAKFSLYYVVACALARGHVDLEDFTPPGRGRSRRPRHGPQDPRRRQSRTARHPARQRHRPPQGRPPAAPKDPHHERHARPPLQLGRICREIPPLRRLRRQADLQREGRSRHQVRLEPRISRRRRRAGIAADLTAESVVQDWQT